MSDTQYVVHKEALGAWIARFIADEEPTAAAVAAAAWNHFAPGFVRALVPGSVITSAVKSSMDGLSNAVKGQVVSFSVPAGILSDVLDKVETAVPGAIRAIEDFVEPGIVAVSRAMGIIPAAPTAA